MDLLYGNILDIFNALALISISGIEEREREREKERERERERERRIWLMGFISYFRYNSSSIRLQPRCKNIQPWPPGGTILRLMCPRVSDGRE
jgi:hypothetical protein